MLIKKTLAYWHKQYVITLQFVGIISYNLYVKINCVNVNNWMNLGELL